MIYEGLLNIDKYGCLRCGEKYLISAIENDFKIGEKVFIRYYLTNKVVSLKEAKQALIVKTIGGDIDELDFILYAYSEYTIMEYNEELIIAGYNLFEEFSNANGKYLILIIESV
ncbi:MAG: hypothetical protein HXX18_01610 [Bacteroidetes bacterium]|nr:hypothetical protein [Bacteroidota bacterium]